MALFKFRKAGDEAGVKPSSAETVEGIRKRAKHRLLGAAVLVLAGVVGFPLVFDSQPRPVAVDIPIEIPDKAKAKPLAINPDVKSPVAAAPEAAVITETREEALGARQVETVPAKAEPPVAPQPTPKAESKTEARATPPSDSKSDVKTDDKSQTQDGRFVVQVGAYADPSKAREARQKVEHAGMKTYTQEVQTKDGSRIRVRVGPFASRAEAEKAAARIKKLDLAAAVLSL